MIPFFATILSIIFIFLSGIHIYWACGGQWATGAVIPTMDNDQKVIMPGVAPTLIIAVGLLGFAFISAIQAVQPDTDFPVWLVMIHTYGLWFIAVIFMLRATGDFNYVGFFKKKRQTAFAKNDTRYYSPLCLFIGVSAIVLLLIR